MSLEMHEFQFNLETNLLQLHQDLNNGTYKHGQYRKFIVCDNKRREISVASVRDRVVHRLLYDYLVPIWDRTFIFDAWSCRKDKGLLTAIERTQKFLKDYPRAYIWRADIRKFFDSVNHDLLLKILARRIKDPRAMNLAKTVIKSFTTGPELWGGGVKGMPIGNLTSQIFCNIYLNELDRFVKHKLKVKGYLRYGDDFLLFEPNKTNLKKLREETENFLTNVIKLTINPKNDLIVKAKNGLKFLGVEIWPTGRRLKKSQQKKNHKTTNFEKPPKLSRPHKTTRNSQIQNNLRLDNS